MRARLVAAIALLLGMPLGGCLDAYREFDGFDKDEPYRNVGVFEGGYMMGGGSSVPLIPGFLRAPLRPEVVILESDRPAYGAAATAMALGSAGSAEGDESRVDIVMAIWRPDNYTLPMPILVDAGPYFEQDGLTMENQTQSTPRLVQSMLPRGYAVVQLAVRGTGTAGGCMDLLGPDETADLDQALTWLGTQPWSNGNIGLIGVSYDGSTPWTAAGTGNPHVKTIVPISGLPDIYDLMLRNGSAEARAALMHGAEVYWGFGFSQNFPQSPLTSGDMTVGPVTVSLGQPLVLLPPSGLGHATGRKDYQDRQNLVCPEAIEGQAVGQASAAEGSRLPAATQYWTERDHRDDVLANYKGSVFLIHGLQDWNVDPHAAIPFNNAVRAQGLEVKEWYGQWDHKWPDSDCTGDGPEWSVPACRMDFGEVLARWFDKHLLGYSSAFNSFIGLSPEQLDGLFEVVEGRLNATQKESVDRTFGAIRAANVDLSATGDWPALRQVLVTESHRLGLLETGPAVQVQDNIGVWRNLDAFPPTGIAWQALSLGADGTLGGQSPGQITLKASTTVQATNVAQFVSEPFPDGVHISGLPQVKVPFSVSGQGGFLAAWLFDVDPNGLVRSPTYVQVPISEGSDVMTWKPAGIPIVGHAQMNLRYYAGGETPQPLVPNERYVAQIEFEPLDVHIPAGHSVMLWLLQYGYPEQDGQRKAGTPSDVTLLLDEDARLVLPTVDIDARTVFPVPGVAFPNSTVVPEMYVRMPTLPGVSAGQPGQAEAAPAPPRQPAAPVGVPAGLPRPCVPECAA